MKRMKTPAVASMTVMMKTPRRHGLAVTTNVVGDGTTLGACVWWPITHVSQTPK